MGPETGDDAGVYLHNGEGLVATADFITPVCDDPRRFGRVAATNSVSDVYAMGGRPLFALNLCCFPRKVPREALTEILEGAADVMRETGTVLAGGHTVEDAELKYGLAVIGRVDPDRILTNAGARAGDRLVLTKPIGTGVLINAYKVDKLDAEGLEPAMVEMERTNAAASELALRHGARSATDITGFGLAGHAMALARSSKVALQLTFDRVPVLEGFYELVRAGVSTGSTGPNRHSVADDLDDRAGLSEERQEVLFDPQTSGGLLLSLPPENVEPLLRDLRAGGHTAAEIGEVLPGPPRLVVV